MNSIRNQSTYVVFLVFMVVVNLIAMGSATAGQQPKIQMAIILDTSNSMDGLINQTRHQLWQVVNEFSKTRQNGQRPVLEIALFEYGNDNNSAKGGFVRRLNTFTRELDAVSEGLFSLTTRGGSEYSGFAIKTAVEHLQWSQSSSDIKTIFIAGNESFRQGPVDYRDAIKLAAEKGIAVNTIHAGDNEVGINDGWQDGAMLAGGSYISIDANQQIVHIVTPQDARIAELNAKLNETYVPYGENGSMKLNRQMEQDEQTGEISIGLLAKRAEAKSSDFYSNSSWDLVDALGDGEVSEESLAKLEPEALPEPMKLLSTEQKVDYLREKAQLRDQIKQEIENLSRQRADFVAEEKRQQSASAPDMGEALGQAVKKQAEEKGFVIE